MKKIFGLLSIVAFVAVAAAAALAAVTYVRTKREEALAELEDEMYDPEFDYYAEVDPAEGEMGDAIDDAHPLEH